MGRQELLGKASRGYESFDPMEVGWRKNAPVHPMP